MTSHFVEFLWHENSQTEFEKKKKIHQPLQSNHYCWKPCMSVRLHTRWRRVIQPDMPGIPAVSFSAWRDILSSCSLDLHSVLPQSDGVSLQSRLTWLTAQQAASFPDQFVWCSVIFQWLTALTEDGRSERITALLWSPHCITSSTAGASEHWVQLGLKSSNIKGKNLILDNYCYCSFPTLFYILYMLEIKLFSHVLPPSTTAGGYVLLKTNKHFNLETQLNNTHV